jgi:hypothetical protein
MTLVLSDHDVVGAVAVIQRIIDLDWSDFRDFLDLRFFNLVDVGLDPDATDRQVWQACQSVGAVLVTGNRAANEGGLESIIRNQSTAATLPVITLSDSRRILRDRSYAQHAAEKLVDYLDNIDGLRGAGRLFIP